MNFACPSCAHDVLPFLDLGKQPYGNVFVKPGTEGQERLNPLKLAYCPHCHLVSQYEPPSNEGLREDYTNYKYVPWGKTLAEHYDRIARELVSRIGPREGIRIVDIGSNDGTLLGGILRARPSAKVLGVEPAVNISNVAAAKGVPTIRDFFTKDTAKLIAEHSGKADVVTFTQVLQHMPHISDLRETVKELLAPNGMLMVEGRYMGESLRSGAWDSFYLEMLQEFSLISMESFLAPIGLKVFDAVEDPIYGGSLRIWAAFDRPAEKSVNAIRSREIADGLTNVETYLRFAQRAKATASELSNAIKDLNKEGKVVAAYGASSTGATLLNFAGLTKEDVKYIVDENPMKQGFLSPGSHIPIVPLGELKRHPVDAILLLAWRLRDEILPKIRTHSGPETQLIVPIPDVRSSAIGK